MEHDTDSLDCACGPEYLVPCDEHGFDERCWKCEGRNGCVAITREEAEREEVTCIIVHQDI